MFVGVWVGVVDGTSVTVVPVGVCRTVGVAVFVGLAVAVCVGVSVGV